MKKEIVEIADRYYPAFNGTGCLRPSKLDPDVMVMVSFGTRDAAEKYLDDLESKSGEES